MDLVGDLGQGKLCLVYLENTLISMPNRCTVCAKYTMSKEIFLATRDGHPR
jgi:hypothetical protein